MSNNNVKNQIISNNDILFDYDNIEYIRKCVREDSAKESPRTVYRMVEKTGSSCDVKITDQSRKSLVKSLLK